MRRLGLWWVPLLLVLAPLLGRMPAARDIAGYFVPMRVATAHRLGAGEAPWLNDRNGCGEAWFADPETGGLYPPHWIYLLLPASWGMSLEIGLHLALLALGVGMLARRLGADGRGRLAAEVAAWSAGPVLTVAGMINNLDTLAWVPWMVLAAGRRDRLAVPLTALAGGMAWLAGEPVVFAFGAAVAWLAAPRRGRAAAGIGLALAIVAVQLLPFLAWVGAGDRGGGEKLQYLAGSVAPLGWLRVLAPGIPEHGPGTYFVKSLFVGGPFLVLALLGLRRRWRWGLAAAGLAVLATLPAIGAGEIYLALTRSLLRYPSRFAVLALALLLPFVGAVLCECLDGRRRAAAVIVGVLALAAGVLSPDAAGVLTGVVTGAALVLAAALPGSRRLRAAAVALGALACIGAGWRVLDVRPPARLRPGWAGVAGAGRLYTPPPPPGSVWWLTRPAHGLGLWPTGYANLVQGVSLVRTDAPLADRALAAHLKRADVGPAGRWWLDAAGARWAVLGRRFVLPGLDPVAEKKGLWLYENRRALPLASLWRRPPEADATALAPGTVAVARPRPERVEVRLNAAGRSWLVVPETPVRGWRWFLDGRPVRPGRGPGILQVFEVDPGGHRLSGRYRPPGLDAGAAISILALLGIAGLWLAAQREPAASR